MLKCLLQFLFHLCLIATKDKSILILRNLILLLVCGEKKNQQKKSFLSWCFYVVSKAHFRYQNIFWYKWMILLTISVLISRRSHFQHIYCLTTGPIHHPLVPWYYQLPVCPAYHALVPGGMTGSRLKSRASLMSAQLDSFDFVLEFLKYFSLSSHWDWSLVIL